MLVNGIRLRDSEFGDGARAGFCLMGACQDCWVWMADGGRLRACTTPVVDGLSITATAAAHGYSRAGFYLVETAFEQQGMVGLIDERPGRRGPLKLNDDIMTYLRQAPRSMSGAALAAEVETRFGVSLHRRTLERARRR